MSFNFKRRRLINLLKYLSTRQDEFEKHLDIDAISAQQLLEQLKLVEYGTQTEIDVANGVLAELVTIEQMPKLISRMNRYNSNLTVQRQPVQVDPETLEHCKSIVNSDANSCRFIHEAIAEAVDFYRNYHGIKP